jgi:hypothetical protein
MNQTTKSKCTPKKKQIDKENRVFNHKWTENYCFVERFGQSQCAICFKIVAANKEYNIRRHWETKHNSHLLATLKGKKRKSELSRLLRSLENSDSIFRVDLKKENAITKSSYDVALLLARKLKPFSDGEFVKDCVMSVVKNLCPERSEDFNNVSLSSRTIRRRIEEMSFDVSSTIKSSCKKLLVYSIALDESTDAKDTAQLSVIIRGVTEELEVFEEFLQICHLRGKTTGIAISNAVIKCIKDWSLDTSKLVCITTDGAPAMVGEKNGAASLIERHCYDQGNTHKIHRIHCIIHIEMLCAKSATLVDVMSTIVKIVSTILSRSLYHRQFRSLLDEVKAHYGDLQYFTQVRWLSRGTMLTRVWELRNEISSFIKEKQLPYTCLKDSKWIARLAFLTDVCEHLNKLNIKLQGKNLLITDMFSQITGFETKLRLWASQISRGMTNHFTRLSQSPIDDINFDECTKVIATLSGQFFTRFASLKKLKNDFKIFTSPFDFLVEDAPVDLQMDLVDLQSDEGLKSRFLNSPLIQFYQHLKATNKFRSLTEHSQVIIAMFGSTYFCEQLFSKMKYAKSPIRSQISDDHLNDILRLSSSSIKPKIQSLVLSKQTQSSH